MTTGALIFWLLSWTFVLGLVGWSYNKILRDPKHFEDHFDPDGIGPAEPRVPGDAEGPPPEH